MDTLELIATAQKLMSGGKGILAADESTGTIGKRFEKIGVQNTEANRRDYRELLFRTRPAMDEYISGVILFDETIRQKAADGTPLIELIRQAGCVPGIKVDKGTAKLPGHDYDTSTEGLDGLRERLLEYHEIGARFTKWRAVFRISEHGPEEFSIVLNSCALAQYAVIAQECGLVPIVEPEVLMEGDHDLALCEQVTTEVLESVFFYLKKANVLLEGLLLKPNMILPSSATKADTAEVAAATVRVLKRCVPAAVQGVVFLSGGQSESEATERLCAINQLGPLPFPVSFSYGRALQEAAQKSWRGDLNNVSAAQSAFAVRARMNSLASQGRTEKS